jgi:hypothetical protein
MLALFGITYARKVAVWRGTSMQALLSYRLQRIGDIERGAREIQGAFQLNGEGIADACFYV